MQDGLRNSGGHFGTTKLYGNERFNPDMIALDSNVELWDAPQNMTMGKLLLSCKKFPFLGNTALPGLLANDNDDGDFLVRWASIKVISEFLIIRNMIIVNNGIIMSNANSLGSVRYFEPSITYRFLVHWLWVHRRFRDSGLLVDTDVCGSFNFE